MFCYQCEQTLRGKACDTVGICGKQSDVAALQDLIIYQLKGIGYLAHEARKNNIGIDESVDRYTVEALFYTVTNVNFDSNRLCRVIESGNDIADNLISILKESDIGFDENRSPDSAKFRAVGSFEELVSQGEKFNIPSTQEDEDLRSLQQLLTIGLKGLAAYVDHALILDRTDEKIFKYIHEALAALNDSKPTVDSLVSLNMKCGEINIRAMELLDEGHTTRYGHPEPTVVSTGTKKGPAIIISGHDLHDLESLLKQTEGTGVNIYTHGEMLPAHGYPELKKYAHLAGHFGTAWQNQQKEFDNTPAAFLFTTNCIQKPKNSYMDQVFTTGLVGWPGVTHINNNDFSVVIKKALDLGGFEESDGKKLMTGFARNAVLSVADKVIEGVKSGAIKHFFLVGGCDGSKPSRNYYTEFVEKTPENTIVLTLACGKFKFNYLNLGDIGGIPRLLDTGQCNDAYSAVQIALALAKAFDCGMNDLPLSLILSWYEQKAVVILLSLLHLGIRGIRIGPSLPAFISPNILNFLVENFDIKPISTPDEDLKAILGQE